MKYVMFEREENGLVRSVPVIFPDTVSHIEVAQVMILTESLKGYKAVSAGFLHMHVSSCHGKSTSTGLSASSLDQHLMNGHDYHHGLTEVAPSEVKAELQSVAKPKAALPGWNV